MKQRKNKRKPMTYIGSNEVDKYPTNADANRIYNAYNNKYVEFMNINIKELITIKNSNKMKGTYLRALNDAINTKTTKE